MSCHSPLLNDDKVKSAECKECFAKPYIITGSGWLMGWLNQGKNRAAAKIGCCSIGLRPTKKTGNMPL